MAWIILAGCGSHQQTKWPQRETPPLSAIQPEEAVQLANAVAQKEVPSLDKYLVTGTVYSETIWLISYRDPSDHSFGWPATFDGLVYPDKTAKFMRGY
jgi:hypothetical protein